MQRVVQLSDITIARDKRQCEATCYYHKHNKVMAVPPRCKMLAMYSYGNRFYCRQHAALVVLDDIAEKQPT